MQNCPKCQINIRGDKECCPLCGSPLSGNPEDPAFPALEHKKISRLTLSRIVLFLCIIFEVFLVTAMFLSRQRFVWAPLAMLAAVVVYLDVRLVLFYRDNYLRVFTSQVYLGMIVCLVVDKATNWHGWSVTWVLPVCFFGLVIVTFIVGVVLPMDLEDYIVYFLFTIALCLLQIIPLLRGSNPFPVPAILSIAADIIFAAGLFVFRGRETRSGARKYFNT